MFQNQKKPIRELRQAEVRPTSRVVQVSHDVDVDDDDDDDQSKALFIMLLPSVLKTNPLLRIIFLQISSQSSKAQTDFKKPAEKPEARDVNQNVRCQ